MLLGVTQRSILGSTLFTAVINDLTNVITSSDMYLFADDGKTVGAVSTAHDRDALVQNNMQPSMDKNERLDYLQFYYSNLAVVIYILMVIQLKKCKLKFIGYHAAHFASFNLYRPQRHRPTGASYLPPLSLADIVNTSSLQHGKRKEL